MLVAEIRGHVRNETLGDLEDRGHGLSLRIHMLRIRQGCFQFEPLLKRTHHMREDVPAEREKPKVLGEPDTPGTQ